MQRYKNSNIVTFNYSCYGRSEGSLTEQNIFIDAFKIAETNYESFYIFGYSLGCSI